MPSPFPGMDPYLEHPVFWSEFHNRLIVAIADMLGPSLGPKYYIGVETRTYLDDANDELLVGIPAAVLSSTTSTNPDLGNTVLNSPSIAVQDRPLRVMLPMPIEVKERYLEVRERGTDAAITVIEVLSPKNKRNGKGRDRYQKKRQTILGSLSHLIEIDLLRRYEPMEMMGEVTKSDYRILISRSHQRPFADLYGFTLKSAIPWFPLPLKPGDEELTVDLQAIITGVYDRAGYDLRLDYRQPPPSPPLSLSDSLWLEKLLTPLRGE